MDACATSALQAGVPTERASGAPTVAETLAAAAVTLAAAGVASARLDADVLLAAAWGIDRTGLYVRSHEVVPAPAAERFAGWLRRRADREPVAYIRGRQEFWSLDLVVTPDVLVPRPETELLVELALSCSRTLQGALAISDRSSHPNPARRLKPVTTEEREAEGKHPLSQMGEGGGEGDPMAGCSICDLATGSGCVAVALARDLSGATVWALDVSEAALAVAATNTWQHGVADRVHMVRSDLFAAVPGRRFDVIVTNPPYVACGELAGGQPELAYEPRLALDGGETGLDVISRILAAVPDHLVAGGWLVMEIGADQGGAVTALAGRAGLRDVAVYRDYAGLPRVLVGRL